MEDAEKLGWLKGWKEISKYLNRSICTLIRWERNGLPIMRDPGGRPIAKKDHIDKWLIDMNRKNYETGAWNNPGIGASLEYEDQRERQDKELEERIIHAHRLRARY